MVRTEQAKKPIYSQKYCFRLESLPLELVAYVTALKETLHYSPWFQSLVFRSLVEKDDRARVMKEFKFKDDEYSSTNFILLIIFKDTYRLLLSEAGPKAVNLNHDESGDKLLMFPAGVPSNLTEQWDKLNVLVGKANPKK